MTFKMFNSEISDICKKFEAFKIARFKILMLLICFLFNVFTSDVVLFTSYFYILQNP